MNWIVEAALEKEIGQRLHQILGVDAEIVPGVFRKLDPLHGCSPEPKPLVELPALPLARSLFGFRRGALPFFRRETALFRPADAADARAALPE